MRTTKCFECGNEAKIVSRSRETVPLHEQKNNCHWYKCVCGHRAWKWIRSLRGAVYGGTGVVCDA